jgi:nucleotide-binding universal stress UspA family protein
MARIVVGVDGSEESKEALRWALEEARLRRATVRAVNAFHTYAITPGYGPREDFAPEALRRQAEEFLSSMVSDVAGKSRQVKIEEVLAEGRPANVLLEAAEDADLLVVGSRGHGGFVGLLLGSVSQQCATHAPCPVLIVRGKHMT